MKRPFLLFLFVFICFFKVQAETYLDGQMVLERQNLSVPLKYTTSILPAPKEIEGFIMIINYEPKSSYPNQGIYLFMEKSGSILLCDDYSKEFVEKGEHINISMVVPLKDGVYISTSDISRRLQKVSMWRCGYDGKITRIVGLDDTIQLISPFFGQKSTKLYISTMPFPSNEKGKYNLIGWFLESTGLSGTPGKTVGVSWVLLDLNTLTATEITRINANDVPYSFITSGFWTNGTTAIYTTDKWGILKHDLW